MEVRDSLRQGGRVDGTVKPWAGAVTRFVSGARQIPSDHGPLAGPEAKVFDENVYKVCQVTEHLFY